MVWGQGWGGTSASTTGVVVDGMGDELSMELLDTSTASSSSASIPSYSHLIVRVGAGGSVVTRAQP